MKVKGFKKKKGCLILITLIIAIFFTFCKKLETGREMAVKTDDVIVSNTIITAKGTIVDLGNKTITNYGFCWSYSDTPTISDSYISFSNSAKTGSFSANLLNIKPDKEFYVRAFISNGNEISYGKALKFSSTHEGLLINTVSIKILTTASVEVYGEIMNIGSLKLLDYGHCFSNNALPDISSTKSTYGELNTDKSFSSVFDNLFLEKAYYARSYAQIDDNTYLYGEVKSIVIPDLKVRTDTFNILNSTTAELQGTIIQLGIPVVTDHGFCWSVSTSNPNYNDNKISLGAINKTRQYKANLENIINNATYYFRAYATDGNFIKYGTVKHFKINK